MSMRPVRIVALVAAVGALLLGIAGGAAPSRTAIAPLDWRAPKGLDGGGRSIDELVDRFLDALARNDRRTLETDADLAPLAPQPGEAGRHA